MKNQKRYSLSQAGALTGLFKTNSEIYRAQEVLTDFGYPKEMVNIQGIDKEFPKKESGFLGSWSFTPFITNGRLQKGPVLTVSVIIAAVFIASYLISISQLSSDELLLLTLVWSAFTFVCLVLCAGLGYLVAVSMSSPLSEEESQQYKNMMSGSQVLITVAPRNSADAQDIAREWKEIGGEVIKEQ